MGASEILRGARSLVGKGRRRLVAIVSGSESSVTGPRIALTYDDGPHPDVTPRLLDLLAEHGAKATFFVIGDHVESHPELVRRAASEGHTIGAHSMRHPDFAKISTAAAKQDTIEAFDAIERATERRTMLYRPPHGHLTLRTAFMLRRMGAQTWLWDIDSRDWRDTSTVDAIVDQSMLAAAGGVVLMHDTSDRTLEATRVLLDRLSGAGVEFVGL